MKILHICSIGVTARTLLLPQIDYLRSRGLAVHIACSPDAIATSLRDRGYIIHPIPIDRQIAPLRNLASLVKLWQLMRREQYDLVHVHTSIAAVLGRLAAKLAGVPRIVYTVHGFPFHDQLPPAKYWLYFSIEKVCARFTDFFLTQSHEDWVNSSRMELCPAHKVRHLNNGIDSQRFSRQRLNPVRQKQLRQSLNISPEDGPIIGTIGRLTREKGFAYLVEAITQLMPRFPNLRLLIVGGELKTDPEPFQAELIQRAIDLGVRDRITFTGFRDDIPELLGLMDIFTLPTYFGEGLPRSILEAMAMGLPVVTTDIRGCREAVKPGLNGLIVPPRDSKQLANALATLLADPALRQQLGAASRARVEAEFDERLVFQRLADTYCDLGIVLSETASKVLTPIGVDAIPTVTPTVPGGN
ncbi:MAG: glycosyltransferase family 4 protein [Leptolyngbyaceae cyanobacterium]